MATQTAWFEFELKYRPGLVHQVPDALSRLHSPSNPMNDIEPDLNGFRDTDLVTTREQNKEHKSSNGTPDNPAIPLDDEDKDNV